MTLEQCSYITQIRNEFEMSERARQSLYSSIKTLSEDLYNKDTHFIFELIQNAEDNAYTLSEPSLSFHLVKSDPTKTPGSNGALIVHNNEEGFSRENVDAICKVGQSTKTKIQGYIGEKGIGFKSVFRVTSKPYIFSNGYRFCLPEHDELTKLGYIIPQWVDDIPRDLDPSGTTIILPLDKPQFPYESVEKMLLDIDPVTILFLSKLKEIVVEIESGYRQSIKKDDTQTPLVQVQVEIRDRDSQSTEIQGFIVHTRSFDKPLDINSEKRKGIDKRDVSIALPLNSEANSAGKIFAYLPVHEDTGLPFLLNADFLLPSSREAIRVDEPWNKWLRDCIPDVFVEAFEKCLDLVEFREVVYRFIPLESHTAFFRPVVEEIRDRLNDREVVLTEPDGKKCKPSETWTAGKNFRSLLSQETYPEVLLTNRLVLVSIEAYKKQLEFIGVRRDHAHEIVGQCFMERRWIEQHNLDWILESYQYLLSANISETHLVDCPIVPIETDGEILWSCVKELPIYFERDKDCEQALGGVPECAQIPLAFLDKGFYGKINGDKRICAWMTEKLGVKSFSKKNYAIDTLESFKKRYKDLSEDDLVSVTYYLSQFAGIDGIDFKDIPVLLSDNRKMLLSEAKALPGVQALVTPVALDPETGWQNIFVTGEDRQHIISLSNRYIYSDGKTGPTDGLENLWSKMGITRYPSPRKHESDEYGSLTAYEKDLINKHYSRYRRKVANWRPFELLNHFVTLDGATRTRFSWSLVDWLNNLGEKMPWLKATVKYFHYSEKRPQYDSELLHSLRNIPWLPTTKGYARPDEAFRPSGSILDIFSGSVPYFEGNLPKNIIELLGIREQVTAEELVTILEQQSQKGSGSRDFAERVYRYLASLNLDYDIKRRFESGKLFFIPAETTAPRWASINEVIWSDRSEVLGDEFFYLERYYPKLKGFFVNILCVKKDVDPECFAWRWRSLQVESDLEEQKVEKILTSIYRELVPVGKINREKRPQWWDEFRHEVKVWTSKSMFEPPESVYIPDDGELKQIFQDSNGVSLVWRPQSGSNADWEKLYLALGLRYLSDAVISSVVGNNGSKRKEDPEWLTNSAKILIVTWIFEKHPEDYEILREKVILQSLLKTAEFLTDELNVAYQLGETRVEKSCDAYWDIDSGRLLISKSSQGHVKNSVAWAIARGLMPNHASTELSNRIEVVLGEKDWEWRVQRENLTVPGEVLEWLDSLRVNVVALEYEEFNDPDLCPDESTSASQSSLDGGSTVIPPDGVSVQVHPAAVDRQKADVSKAHDREADLNESSKPDPYLGLNIDRPSLEPCCAMAAELPEHESRNPERRATRVVQQGSMAPDRITEVRERSISVSRDMVKQEAEQYLRHQYTNPDGVMFCQICQRPLPFQLDDGTYYVEKVEFLTDLMKLHYQNYLALCPNHGAMFQHANGSHASMRDLFKRMQGTELEIILAKKPVKIYFTKEHILDLMAVLALEEAF